MTFLRWLRLQTDRADRVGDFARDATADRGNKPRGRNVRLSDWDNYMTSSGASDGARAALREAWREYWSVSMSANRLRR